MCEFCQDGWTEEGLRGTDGIVYDEKNDKWYIFAEHFAGSRTRINANFCPECGRKLKNEKVEDDLIDHCDDTCKINDNCVICKLKLFGENLAYKWDGKIRLDSFGRAWCKKCTDEHDSIDFDE